LRNFEIAVRGPFDVSERMYIPTQVLSSQASLLPTSPVIRPASVNLIRKATITTLMRQNSINVNPNHNYQPSQFGLDSAYGDESRSVFSDNSGQSNGRLLLNSARGDQCWDILFMICGGTGLTPMLQLVSELFKFFFFLPMNNNF
jgi:hypothetical protein